MSVASKCYLTNVKPGDTPRGRPGIPDRFARFVACLEPRWPGNKHPAINPPFAYCYNSKNVSSNFKKGKYLFQLSKGLYIYIHIYIIIYVYIYIYIYTVALPTQKEDKLLEQQCLLFFLNLSHSVVNQEVAVVVTWNGALMRGTSGTSRTSTKRSTTCFLSLIPRLCCFVNLSLSLYSVDHPMSPARKNVYRFSLSLKYLQRNN